MIIFRVCISTILTTLYEFLRSSSHSAIPHDFSSKTSNYNYELPIGTPIAQFIFYYKFISEDEPMLKTPMPSPDLDILNYIYLSLVSI